MNNNLKKLTEDLIVEINLLDVLSKELYGSNSVDYSDLVYDLIEFHLKEMRNLIGR